MRYAFDSFEFDADRETLSRDGLPLPVRPKLMALLASLIDRRGRLVYKRELVERLWPDVSVGETSLSTLLGEARALLGDTGERQAMIRTVAGRGYRFVAAVELRPDLQAEDPVRELRESCFMDRCAGALGDIDTALNRLARGRPAPLLITGPAKSGKSRLMAELVAMARARGFLTAQGRCIPEPDGALLRPWIEILRSLLEETPEPSPLVAADLRDLVRCDSACLRWLGPGNRGVSAQARFRILDSVCRFLATTARRAPSVLILEDLEWADPSSLSLFDQCLMALPQSQLMLVATHCPVARVGVPQPLNPLGQLKATGALQRIRLPPLRPAERVSPVESGEPTGRSSRQTARSRRERGAEAGVARRDPL